MDTTRQVTVNDGMIYLLSLWAQRLRADADTSPADILYRYAQQVQQSQHLPPSRFRTLMRQIERVTSWPVPRWQQYVGPALETPTLAEVRDEPTLPLLEVIRAIEGNGDTNYDLADKLEAITWNLLDA